MSIQDESFPNDDLEFSQKSDKHMVFPHPRSRISKWVETNRVEDANQNLVPKGEESTSERDNSRETSNSCTPESETSGKTNTSEPTENQLKKIEYMPNTKNKSISYQDIHSEYTKRRYKHVESKVGQYIANIKALEEKRRGLGKYHRSMPETLSGPSVGESVAVLYRTPAKSGMLRRSENDLDHMHEQDSHSDHETDNYDNLTTTTSSSSREIGQDAGIVLDKQTYEQLLSAKDRNEYLQSQLQEKNADYCRLKQNLETMRVEYTMCKDKLKQFNQSHRLTGSLGNTSLAILGRTSLQCLLYPQDTKERATQTETILTPSPVVPLVNGMEMFATPLTPESKDNSYDHAAVGVLAPAGLKIHKTVATIQPLSLNFSALALEQEQARDSSINNTMGFFRRRSNSVTARKISTPNVVATKNTSKTSNSSSGVRSGDSAIDIDALESPGNLRQSTRKFVYIEKRSQCCAATEDGNTDQSYIEAEINDLAGTSISAGDGYGSRKRRDRKNLRSRIKRLFGACTKCEESNLSIDSTRNSQQQSFSQIPLLEKSSTNSSQNLC